MLPDLLLSALPRIALMLALTIFVPLPIAAQFGAPQFQINSYTTGDQRSPGVAMAPNGQFVVVWRSSEASGDSQPNSIQAACFEANGNLRVAQFQVNQYTTGSQDDPDVEIAGNGDFVIAWYSNGSNEGDTDGQSVHARRYNANCTPKGPQFQVNTYTSGAQLGVGVEVADDGGFIVLWRSNGSAQGDTQNNSVQARRYAANGVAIDGTEFQVNTYTTSLQREGQTAFRDNGDFVVVFKSQGSADGDTSGYSVHARRYAANGVAMDGTEFQVNTYTTNTQSSPDVAVQSDGDFLIVWGSYSSDLGDNDGAIIGRLYDANGLAKTGEFRINSYTPGSVADPRVSVTDDDNFVVTWRQSGSPEDPDDGIRSAFVNATASPSGRVQVNDYTASSQFGSRVSVASTGQFVVSWHSFGSPDNDDDSNSVQARLGQVPFFLDGFETGDTSAWSGAAP